MILEKYNNREEWLTHKISYPLSAAAVVFGGHLSAQS
jgi:hypothetical protein